MLSWVRRMSSWQNTSMMTPTASGSALQTIPLGLSFPRVMTMPLESRNSLKNTSANIKNVKTNR